MNTQPGPTAAQEPLALPAGTREEIDAARLRLLAQARRCLAIELPLLRTELYSSPTEMSELRRIASSGRGARIRLLLHDPAAALREGHRLIGLIQRLPSVLQVRVPVDEADLARPCACLLDDAGGYLFQPDAARPQGRAGLADHAARAPLERRFEELWQRSVPAGLLQPLGL